MTSPSASLNKSKRKQRAKRTIVTATPRLFALRVQMHIDRRVERKHQAKSGRIGVKKRDMKLPKEKAEQLAKSLRERGLWSWDDDWPKDEEDCIDIRPISIKIL